MRTETLSFSREPVRSAPAPGVVRFMERDLEVLYTCPMCFRVVRVWPIRRAQFDMRRVFVFYHHVSVGRERMESYPCVGTGRLLIDEGTS